MHVSSTRDYGLGVSTELADAELLATEFSHKPILNPPATDPVSANTAPAAHRAPQGDEPHAERHSAEPAHPLVRSLAVCVQANDRTSDNPSRELSRQYSRMTNTCNTHR
jgi:hypothetical protein